jgi:type I restriction enzyme S subunit
MGQSPKSEFYNYEKNGLPFHQGVKDYGFRFPENTCWSTDGSRIAKAKDILFSVRAPVGRLNIAIEDIILGRGLSAIRHRNNSQSFLFYQLKQIFFQEDMLGGGAIFASVTKEDMLRIGLIKPDKRTESEFNQFGAAIDQNIENLHRQNQLLKEARDILLPRLMTGMIDVEQLDLPEPLGELSSNLTQEPQAA